MAVTGVESNVLWQATAECQHRQDPESDRCLDCGRQIERCDGCDELKPWGVCWYFPMSCEIMCEDCYEEPYELHESKRNPPQTA